MTNSSEQSSVPIESKLFSPGQVGVATFLGNAITGGLLIAMNYFTMKEKGKAWLILGTSTLFTFFVLALILSLPQTASNGMYIGQAIGFRYVAQHLQGLEFANHLLQGGKRASHWTTFGYGMLGMLLMTIISLVLIFTIPDVISPNIKISKNEIVYYEEGATREDAEKLGKALQEAGFFTGDSDEEIGVTLSKKYGNMCVSFVVGHDAWKDREIMRSYRIMGRQIAPAIGGPPIRIRICDFLNFEKKSIEIEK